MKEEVYEGHTGDNFRVYPYLKPDEPSDNSPIFVEADGDYWSVGQSGRVWAVRLHVDAGNHSREHSAELTAAIERCWQWIDGQAALLLP